MRKAFFVAVLGLAGSATGQAKEPSSLTVSRLGGEGPVITGQRVEYQIEMPQSFQDPYDERVVHVRVQFWREGDPGPTWVEAFWHEPFRREALAGGGEAWIQDGEPAFRARFRPLRPGVYQVAAEAFVAGEGTSLTDAEPLVVTGQEVDPFVRVGSVGGRPSLVRGGRPFFPFGFNAGWAGPGGTEDFRRWFARCAGGVSRKWMTSFDGTALEWLSGQDGGSYEGLGRFNQKAAARLDRILELAEEAQVALLLVLQQHSQFETMHWSSWDQNPWNAANGGPCKRSMEFFTNPEVVEGFDRRLRYIVARYADSPAVLAWELWNEVDLIRGYDPAIVSSWSRARVARIWQWDPYGHLVTTSYAMPAFADQDWEFEGYDLVQLHTYFPDYWFALESFAPPLLAFGKPVLVSEFGIDFLGEANLEDQDATHLVNATLLAAMLGYAGGVMSWWWDSWLEKPGPLEGWNRGGRALARLGVVGVSGPFEGVRVQGAPEGSLWARAARVEDGLLVWLHDPLSEWDREEQTAFEVFSGVSVEVSWPLGPCTDFLAVAVYDPDLHLHTGTAEDNGSGQFVLLVPAFSRDLVVRLRCEAQPATGSDAPPRDPAPEEAGPDPEVVPSLEDLPLPPRRSGGCTARR